MRSSQGRSRRSVRSMIASRVGLRFRFVKRGCVRARADEEIADEEIVDGVERLPVRQGGLGHRYALEGTFVRRDIRQQSREIGWHEWQEHAVVAAAVGMTPISGWPSRYFMMLATSPSCPSATTI